nr:zinc finger, CCHC-type [Tanacetum cinerariifolium]
MTDTQTPPPATTVVNSTGAPVTNIFANLAERPEKFNGQNFKRWKQKMFFYVTTLGLARFLKETVPQVEPPAEDPLYNVYCKTTTAKELWESLERKYKTEDAGTKKFVVARFLDYKMVDSKNVISQVQDLQVLIHDIHVEGMTLSETLQVAAIIKNLPPRLVDFKNYLKHKRKELSVEDLVVRLHIEEDMALKDTCTPDSAKANMIEHVGSSSRSNPKGKGKDKRKNDKKSKGKSEFLAPEARIMPKRVNPRKENMVNDDVDMIVMVSDVCVMICKVNLVGTNHGGWWIDTEATCHVCADKSMFHSFRAVDNGHKLYMGNSATADIKGEGDVILKMTSEKELKLTNVFKDEPIDKFVLYKTEVENKLGKKIKVVRSDRGGEYVSPFAELCVKHGIRHEFTAPYLPQQNDIAESKNHTLKEMVTAMLISLEETPYELWMGRKPSYQYLRVWGCLAKVVVPTPKAQKIGPKSMDCIFIGYAKNSSAYSFIVYDSKNPNIQKNTVMESRNASFFENILPCLTKETGSSSRIDDEAVQDKRQRDENDLQVERQDQVEEVIEPRRGKRARTEKLFGLDFVLFMVENEPTSYREAVTSSEEHQWKEAIKSEIDSILQNHTWELIDLPPSWKSLCYKWIFKKKMKADGTIDKYKASNDKMIKFTKDMLKSKFDMKDMGLANVILGIKIIRTQNGLVLSQAHYVDKILNTYNARDSGLARTPIDTSLHLFKNRGVGGVAISWKSSKQTVIAKSTMESEFIALDKCGEEAE